DTQAGKIAIELERVVEPNRRAIWLFSGTTLREVPEIYSGMAMPEITAKLPRPLVNVKVFSIPLWRWLAVILSLALALTLTSLITRSLVLLLRRASSRLAHESQESLIPLSGPIRLILLAVAMRVLEVLSLSLLTRQLWAWLSIVLSILGGAWLIARL